MRGVLCCHVGLLMLLVTLHCDQVLVSMKACNRDHPNLIPAFWMSFAQEPLPACSGTICELKLVGSAQELPLSLPSKWLPVNSIVRSPKQSWWGVPSSS